jgi:hypothetical protein
MAMPTTPTDPTTAAIAWLRSDDGRKAMEQWPILIPPAPCDDAMEIRLDYTDDQESESRWELCDRHGFVCALTWWEVVALVEHAWQERLSAVMLANHGEWTIHRNCYDERNPISIWGFRKRRFEVTAPTLAEALAKALEGTEPTA